MLLQDVVTRQAETRPDKAAIVLGAERLSYGALEALSNRIAHLLRRQGVARGDRVCLLLPKAPRTIATMLGVLKADAAYVPLDPTAPAARLKHIVAAAAPRLIVYDAATAPLLAALRAEVPAVPALSEIAEAAADQPATRPAGANRADDIAHLLFTSGSTGVPKGVMITHANVLSFLDWAVNHFAIGPDDRCSGHSPLQFDLSTFDIYGSLMAGAELHLVPPALNLQPHKLARWIAEARLTQWFSVPAALTLMLRANAIQPGMLPALERLMWCGEVLPTPVLAGLMQRLPGVVFTNLYGPTEATIASSYYTMPAIPAPEDAVPIGRACAGEELVVLDEERRPLPPGAIGDLYIGGVGLSPGYWRDPEKTAAAFIPDPRAPSRRLYRTGDLARLRGDGEMEFLGRADTQIKSRGYRIELGEIEAALATFAELDECAVVGVPTDGFEGTLICAALAPAEGRNIAVAELRGRLGTLLPPYMIPSRWQTYGALPKNSNGKIDRKEIKAAFAHATRTESEAHG